MVDKNDVRPVRVILAATDFSECAENAVRWAASLARHHGARLVLHHALSPPQGAPTFPGAVPYPPEIHEEYRNAATMRLAQMADGLEGISAVTDLQVGTSAHTILQAAEKHAADLVVTGTRGLSGIRHLLLGSTAERLVQHATLPVLAVHPDMAPPEAVRTILVPTDFSDDAEQALSAALRLLAGSPDPKIILFHAFHVPIEYTNLAGGFVLPDITQTALADARTALERVAEPLRKQGHVVETLAREGYAPQAIETEAREHGVDLIAMGTHGRSFLPHVVLGSTAERVVQHAPCPVLTVRRIAD